MAKQVYLAYTQNKQLPTPELLRVYGSYKKALAWLSEIAERHGVKVDTGSSFSRTLAIVQLGTQKWWVHTENLV